MYTFELDFVDVTKHNNKKQPIQRVLIDMRQ